VTIFTISSNTNTQLQGMKIELENVFLDEAGISLVIVKDTTYTITNINLSQS